MTWRWGHLIKKQRGIDIELSIRHSFSSADGACPVRRDAARGGGASRRNGQGWVSIRSGETTPTTPVVCLEPYLRTGQRARPTQPLRCEWGGATGKWP